MLNCRTTANGLLVLLLMAGCLFIASPSQAIIWYQIKFTAQLEDWEMEVVGDFYARRLENAQSEFPGQPTEILVGRGPGISAENGDGIVAYLRGNPEFCSEEGCLLSLLTKTDEGNWRSEAEFLSNGYLMITDIDRGGWMVMVSESNTSCIDLVWNEPVYEIASASGPCKDRRQVVLDKALGESVHEIFVLFRDNNIRHGRVVSDGATVTVSIDRESDRSKAGAILGEIAERRKAMLQAEANSFRLTYDFSDLPRFFVLE